MGLHVKVEGTQLVGCFRRFAALDQALLGKRGRNQALALLAQQSHCKRRLQNWGNGDIGALSLHNTETAIQAGHTSAPSRQLRGSDKGESILLIDV